MNGVYYDEYKKAQKQYGHSLYLILSSLFL